MSCCSPCAPLKDGTSHSKANIADGGVGTQRIAPVDGVAAAVRRVAQVRAAARHAFGLLSGPVAVGAPLPYVARHVVEPVGVRLELVHGAGAVPAVGQGVLDRERPLPDVHPVATAGLE